MAKNSITDYSKTASLNTDIQSVDIDEGCLPSGINNAIRELMADLAAMNDGTVTLTSPAFTSVDINGGTIDGVTIGGASAGAGTFTTGQFNTSLNVDGTVTADGVELSGTSVNLTLFETDQTDLNTRFRQTAGDIYIQTIVDDSSSAKSRLGIDHATGDIFFYEDTGTTAKLFWDASAERLGIGTSSPSQVLEITNGTSPAYVVQTRGDLQTILGPTGSLVTSAGQVGTITNSPFRFTTNNTERMRIDSSGNVGIGTTAPRTNLHVSGLTGDDDPALGSSVAPFLVTNTANSYGLNIGVNNQGDAWLQAQSNTTSTAYDILLSPLGGNVGIGTTSPDRKLDVRSSGTSAETVAQFGNNNIQGGLQVQTNGNLDWGFNALNTRNLTFSTNQTERMRIDSSGNVHIATGGSQAGATVSGTSIRSLDILKSTNTTSGFNQIVFYNPNGAVGTIRTTGSSTAYNTSSDYRLKENVTGITDGIERVKQLNPSRFNFIIDADTTVDGFLAHEAATVVPEAVSGEKDAVDEDGNPEYQGIDQAKLVPLLTAALQEAITKIEDLEARVATLEGN
jgi:hypothetical protein